MSDLIAIAQVVLAVALVYATTWYAIVTHHTWLEERKPVLWVFLDAVAPTLTQLRIENVGKGVANEIKATIEFGQTGKKITWAFPSLGPHESRKVRVPSEYFSLESMLGLGKLTAHFSSSDIMGKSYKSTAVLSFSDFSKSSREAPTIYEESLRNHLKRIPEELKGIGEKLSQLSGQIGKR